MKNISASTYLLWHSLSTTKSQITNIMQYIGFPEDREVDGNHILRQLEFATENLNESLQKFREELGREAQH